MKKRAVPAYRHKLPAWTLLLLILSLLALIFWCIVLTREKLLKNANEMGMLLAQSYAMEEENRTSIYSMLLSLESMTIRDALQAGAGEAEVQQSWPTATAS